jgi:hypothetical protein
MSDLRSSTIPPLWSISRAFGPLGRL